MKLEHGFSVPVPVEQAWEVLLDVQRIAPCLPGASVTSVDGDTFSGRVKVRVGPIQVTYGGTARFVEKDESARRVMIDARGKETRGAGTASAKVTADLRSTGRSTQVTVRTDLAVTGRPAQFGRGVMADVGGKLIGRFADCLAEQLASGALTAADGASDVPADSAATSAPETSPTDQPATAALPPNPTAPAPVTPAAEVPTPPMAPAAASRPAVSSAPAAAGPARTVAPPPPIREAEPIDLLETAGLPVLKRAAPVVGAAVLLALIVVLVRRRRR